MNPDLARQRATNLYSDPLYDCMAAKLLPGEFYVTDQPMLLVTVLGSCVAACIRDRETGIGGMNHFMLPGGASSGSAGDSMRYGACAMAVLIEQVLEAGARRERLVAKVFGGGSVLRGFNHMQVGEHNSRFVRDYLRRENIRIEAEDLNGVYPRKVYFFPATGRVLVKTLKELNNDTLAEREKSYAEQIASVAAIVKGTRGAA